jgi:hypothetical protein
MPCAGEVRRRLRRDVLQPRAGRAGSGPARGVAGAPRTAVQPGQDADSPRRGRVLVPGVRHPPPRRPAGQRQAAHHPRQGAGQAAPEAAVRRGPRPARSQRGGRDSQAGPHHPGLVGLLPERGLRPGVHRPGPPCLARHLPVGQAHAPEQAQRLGHRPVLRRVQQGPAGPVGVRRPEHRRLPHQVLLDQDRPARPRARRGIPR